MKTEDKLRAAIREYTESFRPDAAAWNKIETGMARRAPVSPRSMLSAFAAAAAVLTLVAVRLIPDQVGRVDITTPPTGIIRPAPDESPAFGSVVEGRWSRLSTPPIKAWFSTSVWTGEELLLWTGRGPEPGRGVAYNPNSRRWRELPSFIVGGRGQAPAVWTGKEMIVWGGTLDESGGEDRPPYTDGAAYDPATDRWRRIAESPLIGGGDHHMVWTGGEVLVWGSRPGGDGIVNEFAAYNPSTDRWRALQEGPLEGRYFPNVVWTGREMIVWGGTDDGPVDGAAFDPATAQWREIPAAPLPPRRLASAVWTGSELFVWGGQALDDSDLADGASYNPTTNRWTKTSPAPLSPRHFAAIVAMKANRIFVWGGTGEYVESEEGPPYFNDGAVYDAEADTWHTLPAAPLGPREANAEVAYIGGAVIIWGGIGPGADYVLLDGATFKFSD